jgi:hypothetical protein
MNQNFLTTKTTISDIEAKRDKNLNPYFKITANSQFFYAFGYNLPSSTLQTLSETPYKLVNQATVITYEELPNKDNQGTFLRVKEIQAL